MTVGVRIKHTKVGKNRENMFFVLGISAFLQVTENPKDFKPTKRQKPPVPYPHKVLLMSVGIGGSGDGSSRL